MKIIAQMASGYSIGQMAIWIIIVAAIIAVVFVITQKMGIVIPDWVVKIGWILLLAVIGILAIRFLLSL